MVNSYSQNKATPNKAKTCLFAQKSKDKWAENRLISKKWGKNCLLWPYFRKIFYCLIWSSHCNIRMVKAYCPMHLFDWPHDRNEIRPSPRKDPQDYQLGGIVLDNPINIKRRNYFPPLCSHQNRQNANPLDIPLPSNEYHLTEDSNQNKSEFSYFPESY